MDEVLDFMECRATQAMKFKPFIGCILPSPHNTLGWFQYPEWL